MGISWRVRDSALGGSISDYSALAAKKAGQTRAAQDVAECASGRLSLGWMKLGIVHERIQAGHPQQNGRHERMHRTLKKDTTKPPAASLRAQQTGSDSFRYVFNNECPHEGLNNSARTKA